MRKSSLSPFLPALTNENIDIDNWDDYRKDLFIAKVIFNVTKAFSLSAGYAYEQYKYNDATLRH